MKLVRWFFILFVMASASIASYAQTIKPVTPAEISAAKHWAAIRMAELKHGDRYDMYARQLANLRKSKIRYANDVCGEGVDADLVVSWADAYRKYQRLWMLAMDALVIPETPDATASANATASTVMMQRRAAAEKAIVLNSIFQSIVP